MCGFVAMIVLNGDSVDKEAIKRMSAAIKHRGPDEVGYYFSGPVGFGFRRLSILDLSPTGHQPIFSPDEQKVMVFNGEIYNYVELRKELQALGHRFRSTGDTEVLLHTYLEWGKDSLSKLNGMWAFIIYDMKTGKLFGSRDRFGKKPLYYYQTANYIFFASEIKAILASRYYRGAPNWKIISRFLLNNNLNQLYLDNQTFYSDISQVPEGSAFELDLTGKMRQWRFWSLPEQVDYPPADPAQSFYEILEDAVRLRLRSDVPLGVFLSGGVDSTSVICSLSEINKKCGLPSNGPITAISYCAQEFDESSYIEDTIQFAGAELIRFEPTPIQLSENMERFIWYQDEPVHSFASVIFFELCKIASKNGIKVMLAGGGADEYLAGYFGYFPNYWYTLFQNGQFRTALQEIKSYCRVHGGNPWSLVRGSLRRLIGRELSRLSIYKSLARYKRRNQFQSDPWYTIDLYKHLNDDETDFQVETLQIALKRSVEHAPLPVYLREDDRSTMAHSIEGRSPFLDYRLVSFAVQLPNDWKLRGPWNKYVLREAMRNRIPESVRSRSDKMGFSVPQRQWFADLLYEPMQDLLNSRKFRERDIYNHKAIQRDLYLHKQGKVNMSNRLFNLFQFEIWSDIEKSYHTTRSFDPQHENTYISEDR